MNAQLPLPAYRKPNMTRSLSLLCLTLALLLTACGQKGSQTNPATPADNAPAPTAAPATTAKPDAYWNPLAQFLGGFADTTSGYQSLYGKREVVRHFQTFQKSWVNKDTSLLRKLRQLNQREQAAATADGNATVLYPFSGPDVMHLYALFPNAKRYVMFGLEPEGRRNLQTRPNPEQVLTYLPILERTLDDIMVHTFFKTNDMKLDMRNSKLEGTLPVMLAFLARHECQILGVRGVQVNRKGQVQEAPATLAENPADSVVTGVEIRFRKGEEGKEQTVTYFSLDISDGQYARQVGFQRYLNSLKPTYTYMKSASYLLHTGYFTRIRDQLLDISQSVLQDDTGMPVKFFAADTWTVRLFGQYKAPIRLFANRYQPDLFKQYNDPELSKQVRPLNFRLGYNYYEALTNLQLAVKK
jgi:predicted small lipoprotein YifL